MLESLAPVDDQDALALTANLDTVSEHAPIGLLAFDTVGACLYANAEYRRLSGLGMQAVQGEGWAEAIDQTIRYRILDAWNQAVLKGAPFQEEFPLVQANGKRLTIQIRSTPVYEGAILSGYVCAAEDISLRLLMQGQLRIHFAAMESSTSMIMITDVDGLITWVNPAFTRETGYTFDEVMGKSPGFLSSGTNNQLTGVLAAIAASGDSWKGEVTNKRKDGSLYHEEQIITPVIGTDGMITHYLAIKNDITQRKENERTLLEYSDRLKRLVEDRTKELEKAKAKILKQQRLERDLEIAAQVQRSLLPEHPPTVDTLDIACDAVVARYIGGDVYDFIQTGPDVLYVLMADISGNGIPAALLTASARTTVREKIAGIDSPGQIMAQVNRTLYPDLVRTEMFITMLLLRIEIGTGTVVYANAGHTLTMHLSASDGLVRYLGPTSVPIGVLEDFDPREDRLSLDAEDILVLYSDGLSEAESVQGDFLGESALAEVLKRSAALRSPGIVEAFNRRVAAHLDGADGTDDRSLVVVRRRAAPFFADLPAAMESVSAAAAEARRFSLRFCGTFASELELATTELCTNILCHAYGLDPDSRDSIGPGSGIALSIRETAEGVLMDTYDSGAPFAEKEYREPVLDGTQVNGYGLFLIRSAVDTLEYERTADGRNHWRLEKRCKEPV